jgi:NitT/TauT family transport system substrate-binding protein
MTAYTRRRFLAHLSTLATATSLGAPTLARAEPPPEIDRISLEDAPVLCFAPLYIAEELLRLEGFRTVEYKHNPSGSGYGGEDGGDLAIFGGPSVLPVIDGGDQWRVVSGLHVGCWELMATEKIRAIRDLKGRKVAAAMVRSVEYLWISSILAYIGMDPRTDVQWVETGSIDESKLQFLAGKVDAFLAFPPQPHDVRLHKYGHTIVNTTLDRPWSQYFCCMVAMQAPFARKYPVAAKRALRAMLKAADLCAQDPARVARHLQKVGIESRHDVSMEVLSQLPYDRWRLDNPEDTLRFHALRLHQAGMIKSTPQQIIARGTDWRFLNELKREMKA